jgi:hypothetical protein
MTMQGILRRLPEEVLRDAFHH